MIADPGDMEVELAETVAGIARDFAHTFAEQTAEDYDLAESIGLSMLILASIARMSALGAEGLIQETLDASAAELARNTGAVH